MDEGEVVDGASVVARRKAAEVLELVEAAFHAIAIPVGDLVVRNGNLRERVEGITASAPLSAMACRKSLLS